MHSIYPQKVDFYNETIYKPYNTQKFRNNDNKQEQELKILNFHNQYYHLLNSKHINTENLRMHSGDVRPRYIENIKQKDKSLIIYKLLCDFYYNIYVYDLDEIYTKFYDKYTNTIKIKLNEYYEEIYFTLTELQYYFNDNQYYEIIMEIFSGKNNELNNILKITKQKKKFLKSYENSDEIYEFHDNFKNIVHEFYYESPHKNYKFIMNNLINILNSINHTENIEKYLNSVFSKLIINNIEIPTSFEKFGNSYMEIYIMYRMLNKFDNIEQTSIVMYLGGKHVKNITQILKQTNFFKLIVKNNYDENTYCAKLIENN
jgi:hypothetical protein